MKTYTFQGIYGRNCGNVTPYNGPSKRLQEKGLRSKTELPHRADMQKYPTLRPHPARNTKNTSVH